MTMVDLLAVEAALLRQNEGGAISAHEARLIAGLWADGIAEGISGAPDPAVTDAAARLAAAATPQGPGAPHLSSDASRSAYAAAGALAAAGDERNDDLAWPFEWGAPAPMLVDENAITDAIAHGYDREDVEAHSPVYAEGTMPLVPDEWAFPPARPSWIPSEGEVAAVFASLGSSVDGIVAAFAAAGEALARFADDLSRWRPTGILAGVNPYIRGASPRFVVIDEVHEWTCEAPPVARVVDALAQRGPRLEASFERPDAVVVDVDPVVRISAPLDVDTTLVEALRRGDTIDLSDRRPQAARFAPVRWQA